MPFSRLGASDEHWAWMEEGNDALEKLRAKQLPDVRPVGEAGISKGVWLIRGLQQTLLYRTVMLADGCILGWNGRHPLAALLSARALIETAAVVWDLQRQYSRLIDHKDFKAIYDLTLNRAHATKNEEWLKEGAGVAAVNVLTLLSKLESEIPFVNKLYAQLSEFCHPNYCGHRLLFAQLDTSTGILTFGKDIWLGRGILVDMLTSFSLVGFTDLWLTKIDEQMPKIFELSEASRLNGPGDG